MFGDLQRMPDHHIQKHITSRMQGIVEASVKFILFLSSMVIFLLLSGTYMHTCVQLQSGLSSGIIILPASRRVGSGYNQDYI